MTTKGQIELTFRVCLTESQARAKQCPKHTIVTVSSILTDLIFRRNQRRGTAHSEPTIDFAKQSSSYSSLSKAFQNFKLTQYHHKLQKEF